MEREQAKDIVKGYLEDYLRAKGINTNNNFNCLNPEHQDKHPSMSYDKQRKRCKCFSCGASYDIFDLIGIDYGLQDHKDIFAKAYDLYNINIDKESPHEGQQIRQPAQPKQEDNTQYYINAVKKLTEEAPALEYLRKRGISPEVAVKYRVGYDSKYNTFNEDEEGKKQWTSWRCIIIPTGKSSYIARNIDQPAEPAKKNRYRKKGESLIFNSKALFEADKPIFIVEGELDALSIIEVGGQAVGLGSTSNYKKLISMIETEGIPAQPLMLALDADEEGRKAEAKLIEDLERLQASFYRCDIYGTAKDANEALIKNRGGFMERVRTAELIPAKAEEEKEEAARQEYLNTSAAAYIQNFKNGISESVNTPVIRTGFYNLDEVIDGGLYEGLYIIGAISSLGKTTFALQIMDQLAEQGQDVLIFSLEMARSELMAKSISRLTYLNAEDRKEAKTTRGITAGVRYQNYSTKEKALIDNAILQYAKYAKHIFIHEGIGNIGIEEIKEKVDQHISITGNKPVVLIDYLQILAPYDMRASDKQNTDKAVLELKRLSRDNKITVIGISSFNRDNYSAPVNIASFKESGAIEYSADVLIGLQYNGMDYQEGEDDKKRQLRIRELRRIMEANARTGKAQKIQVKVLKNRNGSKGQAVFDFYAMFNCFMESMFNDFTEVTGKTDPFAELRNQKAK